MKFFDLIVSFFLFSILIQTCYGIAATLPTGLYTNLVAYFACDGDLTDSTISNSISYTINDGGMSYGTDRNGFSNQACNFDGTGYFEARPDVNSAFDSSSMSISLWAKPIAVQNNRAAYLDHATATVSSGASISAGWVFQVPSTDGARAYFRQYDQTGATQSTSQITTLSTTGWNHIVVTKSGVTYNIYVNGILIFGPTSFAGNGNIVSPSTYHQLVIGAQNVFVQNDPANAANKYTGLMDDILVYSRALTASEVVKLYNLVAPTGQPSSQPSGQPSREPSSQPSGQPSRQPTSKPSAQPSTQPSSRPSSTPSSQPSSSPLACCPPVRPSKDETILVNVDRARNSNIAAAVPPCRPYSGG